MRFVPFVVVLLALVSSGQAGEKDNKSLIVGRWEVVKSDDAPTGSMVMFSKDGKLTMIPTGEVKKKIEATYTIDGKKITTTRTEDGKKEVNIVTIQTLNETTLTTVDDKGKRAEMKRVKK